MKKVSLRAWQQSALEEATDSFTEGNKLFLTHATPGGGKTIHGLSVFDQMHHRGDVSHLIILAPSTILVTQWQRDASARYGLELKNSMLYAHMEDFREYNGMIMTYQGMNENAENLRIFCGYNKTLVIGDEIHHVADGQSWGDSFRTAFEPSEHILALTGTPWASNGKRIPYINYGEDGYAIPDFSYKKETAISEKVCRTTEFHKIKPSDLLFIDNENGSIIGEYKTLQDAQDDNVRGAYRKTLQSLKHMKAMFFGADEELSRLRTSGIPDAGGLLVAPDIETAHKFQDDLYSLTGQEYPIVHSKMPKPHEKIDKYRESSDRWLISVDMVTEGVDIKRMQVCIFLSAKNTELFLRQVIGRIERIRNEHNNMDHYGYFFYTDVPEINEIVEKLIEENRAGLALKEQKETEETDGAGDRSKFDDSVSLEDLESEQNGLVANGYKYPNDIVAEAIKRRHAEPVLLSDVPLFIICKVILAERSQLNEKEAVDYATTYNAPLTDKKDRIRKRIAKEVNRKLFIYYGRKPDGKEIGAAHGKINRSVDIDKTDDSTSMDKLERKLDFITETNAKVWT